MIMKRVLVFTAVFFGLLFSLVPGAALAEDGDEGFILRIDGDLVVPAGQTVASVVVISGNVRVEGAISESLTVIEGNAVIAGSVDGELTVINGKLELLGSSRVENVNLVSSDLIREGGATVLGDINERENFFFRGAWAVFSVLLWLGFTVTVLVTGVILIAVAGPLLSRAAESLSAEPGQTILASVLFWVGLPFISVLAFITVIGLPLGLALLLLAPFFWLLGYVVAAVRLGLWITGAANREQPLRPYAAGLAGLLLLQILLILPGFGLLVASLAGLWGTGALTLMAWHGINGRSGQSATAGQAQAPVA